jgi:rhodanese-related sulfurtransferase
MDPPMPRLLSWLRRSLYIALMWSASVCALMPKADWASLGQAIRSRYPEVRHIGTGELVSLVAREVPIILDVRTADEFAISHLEHARHAPTEALALAALSGVDRTRAIVVYCAVGYRSSQTADILRRRGYVNTVNMEGSIFAWANEGRPIFRGTQRVTEVHPYNEYWGRLLAKQYWPKQWRPQ